MKVYQLIYLDYEDTETFGIYLSREEAVKDFVAHLMGRVKGMRNRDNHSYRIIEWETNKLNGNTYENWDDEAMIVAEPDNRLF